MADTQGLQAEEFGMLIAQLEQMLGDYRKSYPAQEPPRQYYPTPIEPGRPTPPGWAPPGSDVARPPQKPYTAYNALAQPVGALAAMADNVNPLTYITGPSVDYLPQGAWTDPVRTGYQHAQDARGALLSGLTAAGQTMEAISPSLGPAEAPLYGAGKLLQAPAAAVRATTRATAASVADAPHTIKTALQRAGQGVSDAAVTIRNPLAAVSEDARAGIGDARVARLQREGEAIAAEYEKLMTPGRPLTRDEIALRGDLEDRALKISGELKRLTGENQLVDARGVGMYPIPEMSGVRQFGTPIINEYMPRVTQPQPRNPLLAHQPGPPMDARGLPDPRFQEGPLGVWRRPGQIPYEDNLDAQLRVLKGQQEVASPSRPPYPLGRLTDQDASPLDRLTAAVNRGEFSVESILRSPNPRQTLEAVAGRYGYVGEDGLQRFAGDLATVGGRRADLGIGRMVDKGPDNLFRTNPQWSQFDKTMQDARSAGRFSDPPTSDTVRSLPEPVETPHGFRDPSSGQWTSGPKTTRQGAVSGEGGGFESAPENPLAKRPRR